MRCAVTFRHIKPSDPIREYAEDRVEKLSKLIERGGEAKVVLSVEKHLHVAHVELLTEGSLRLRGVEKSQDMYGSIDLAVEKIVRQVKRYREKIRDHRGSSSPGRALPHSVFELPEREDEPEASHKIVRSETIVAPEMDVNDAVMQMDLLNTDFLVFTNTESDQLNVVYRLSDGQYGLIEAHHASESGAAARAR